MRLKFWCLTWLSVVGLWNGQSAVLADDVFRVHAIVAVDTALENAETLGVTSDGIHIQRFLQATFGEASGAPIDLQIHLLDGEKLTQANLLRTIASIQCDSNDIVICYYSGHGGLNRRPGDLPVPTDQGTYDSNGRFNPPLFNPPSIESLFLDNHVLALSNGDWVPRQDVANQLMNLPARAAFLFTDCCTNFVGQASGQTIRRAVGVGPSLADLSHQAEVSSERQISADLRNSLFFAHTGFLDVSAVQPGFFSHGDHERSGGIFTNSLLECLMTEDKSMFRGGFLLPPASYPNRPRVRWDELGASWFKMLQKTGEIQRKRAIEMGLITADEELLYVPAINPKCRFDYLCEDQFYNEHLGAWFSGTQVRVFPGGALARNGYFPGPYEMDVIDGVPPVPFPAEAMQYGFVKWTQGQFERYKIEHGGPALSVRLRPLFYRDWKPGDSQLSGYDWIEKVVR